MTKTAQISAASALDKTVQEALGALQFEVAKLRAANMVQALEIARLKEALHEATTPAKEPELPLPKAPEPVNGSRH